MKNLIRTALALMLCLVVCSFLSPTALAETIASGASGDNLNWTLDNEGPLFISGYGDMTSSDGWSEHINEQGATEAAQETAEQTKDDAEAAAESVSQSAAQIETNKLDIDDLKSAFDYSVDFKRAEPTAVANDYGLTIDGYSVYNSQYQLKKYAISAGDEIYVIAQSPAGGKASCIFTNRSNVSQSNLDHLVGEPVTTAVNQKITAPDGAIFIIFCCLKTDDVSGVYTSLPIKNAADIQDFHGELESYIESFVFNVNKATADDGKSYGSTRFDFPIFRGQQITITNNQAGDNAWTCDIVNSAGAFLQHFSVTKGETKTTIVNVDGGEYLRVYQNVYPLVGQIVAESKVEYNYRMTGEFAGVVGETTDIVKLNYKVPTLLQSAQKTTYGQTTVPLSLLHFSDPHGSSTNVNRMIEMANAIGTPLDGIICTGDMVTNSYADGFTWWGDIAGTEKILTCIGNHDVSDGTAYNKYGITTLEAYNTYYAPYIANWGVTHSGTNTYYYKDYTGKKIRLIVLDYLLEGTDATAQNTWLQTALAGAKSNGFTVVIAQHCPLSNCQNIPSNFTMINKRTSYQYPTIYQASVQSFIDDGGEFACFIAGHTHCDMLCINPDYPQQICICVTCTATTGRDNDQVRKNGEKSQDAANVVTIDTTSKTVKLIRIGADIDVYLRPRNVLTISYVDKTLFAQG